MEGVVGGDQLAYQGGSKFSQCPSCLPGGLGNGYQLPQIQVASADEGN